MRSPFAACLAALALLPSASATDDTIVWERSLDAARERAKSENAPLFVAVHLVDEVASDRMIEKVFTADRVVELLQHTVNVAASNAYQVGRADFLEHFGSPTMEEARDLDVAVRNQILKPDADGYVIAPQHVLLAPDGSVILSVPYEIDAAELEWCLVEAVLAVDPGSGVKRSSKARAPQRLVMNGVHDGGGTVPPPAPPPTGAELDDLLDRAGDDDLDLATRAAAVLRLASSDDRRAIKVVGKALGSAPVEAKAAAAGRLVMLRAIGETSPEPYWDMVAEQLDDDDVAVRNEAAVALEQIGAAKAETVLSKFLSREDDPRVRKNLARALGACGYDSSKALRDLVKVAEKDKDPLVRANAVLGIGRLTPCDDGREELARLVAKGDDRVRAAALVAAAWSRDPYWRDVVAHVAKGEAVPDAALGPLDRKDMDAFVEALASRSERTAKAFDAAKAVLGGGSLEGLAPLVKEIGSDRIPRKRLFVDAAVEGE
ncbi:MAG: HEAT repeat domain-containing protein [Planctomycetota bacterium]